MKNILLMLSLALFTPNFLLFAELSDADSAKIYRVPGITVTTTRAEERKDPVPYSEISQSHIRQTYSVADVPQTLSILPSVLSYSQNGNAIGYSILTMRGFDQRRNSVMINGIPQNDPEDHQVYWINFPDITASLDNIQVQRGAGMMNYGSAAIGGSVNLTTSDYIREKGVRIFSGFGMQEYGSNSEIQRISDKSSIEISSGLMGDFAVYGRLSSINSIGYRDNAWAEMKSYFLSAAMFRKNFSVQLNVFGGPVSDGLAYIGLPKAYINDKGLRRSNPNGWVYGEDGKEVVWYSPVRKQEIEEFSQPHYELLTDWEISSNLKLKSSLFYYTGVGYYNYDGSWAGGYYDEENVFQRGMLADWLSGEYEFNENNSFSMPIIQGNVSNKQGGWIPRLIWSHIGGEMTIGAEMRLHSSRKWGKVPFSEKFPEGWNPDFEIYSSNTSVNNFSIFASERYFATEKLILSADAQLVYKNYIMGKLKQGSNYMEFHHIDGIKNVEKEDLFSIDYLFINPRIGATYNLDEKNSIYASGAFTSREPRMRNLYAAEDIWFGSAPQFESELNESEEVVYDFSKPLTKPESMLDFELGVSRRTKNLYLNVNFYWMEYFDELVKSGQTDIWGNPVDGNAPRTRHYGIELSGSAILFDNNSGKLFIYGNATFSVNEIIDYDFVTYSGDEVSLKGNSIAGFPGAMGNLMLEYIKSGFFVNLTSHFVNKFKTDNFGDLLTKDERIKNHLISELSGYYADNSLDGFAVVNATISYTFYDILSFKNLKIMAQVNNLFNKLYAAGAEGGRFFPAAERNYFFGLEFAL